MYWRCIYFLSYATFTLHSILKGLKRPFLISLKVSLLQQYLSRLYYSYRLFGILEAFSSCSVIVSSVCIKYNNRKCCSGSQWAYLVSCASRGARRLARVSQELKKATRDIHTCYFFCLCYLQSPVMK